MEGESVKPSYLPKPAARLPSRRDSYSICRNPGNPSAGKPRNPCARPAECRFGSSAGAPPAAAPEWRRPRKLSGRSRVKWGWGKRRKGQGGASLQFMRKVSGSRKSSKANEAVFQAAVGDCAAD
jgi:hypothetical protein